MAKTTLERQKAAVEKVVAAYSDGQENPWLRAASAVYKDGAYADVVLVPVDDVVTRTVDELSDPKGEEAFDVLDNRAGVLTDEEVREIVIQAAQEPLRQAIRTKLIGAGLSIKPKEQVSV
jgi:hypothetical protein